jgi:hypothetical protein
MFHYVHYADHISPLDAAAADSRFGAGADALYLWIFF